MMGSTNILDHVHVHVTVSQVTGKQLLAVCCYLLKIQQTWVWLFNFST